MLWADCETSNRMMGSIVDVGDDVVVAPALVNQPVHRTSGKFRHFAGLLCWGILLCYIHAGVLSGLAVFFIFTPVGQAR